MHGRLVWTTLVAAAAGWGRLEAQVPGRIAFDSAAYAWEAGRYPEALERLRRLLAGPARDTLLEPIALLTRTPFRDTPPRSRRTAPRPAI